jgi:hypothetical protein
MDRYASEPKSRKDIARFAMKVRKAFGLEDRQWIDVVGLLEYIPFLFPDFHFKAVGDHTLSRCVYADTDPVKRVIRIKRSVYDAAFDGSGRDRFTIAHEIGHFFLMCAFGVKFNRTDEDVALPAYRDPEWQADCFAGELLAPSDLIRGMSVGEVSSVFGVSRTAAETQLRASMGGRMM